jgi:fatty-acid peroxygenase
MFMSVMNAQQISRLVDITAALLHSYARTWTTVDRVMLYDQLQEILCRAVCEWVEVPLLEADVRRRTQELSALFDQAGAIGLGHLWSRLARKKTEQWITAIIADIRAGRLSPSPDSAAAVIARHRDLNDNLLDAHTAAVELLNILRPVIAVSLYMTFIGVALHAYPRCRQQLETGTPEYAECFVQEVRRFFPFFPTVFARVRSDLEWRGYHFPQGRRVLLDVHGTNRDARVWEQPDMFLPERFRQWDGSPYNFIPQGGGDHFTHHRCAGEWITLALMKMTVDFLTRQLQYDVPAQDLRINDRRLPAIPRSRFVMRNIRVQKASLPA